VAGGWSTACANMYLHLYLEVHKYLYLYLYAFMYAQTISVFAIFASMEIIKNATETVGVDAGDNVVVMGLLLLISFVE